MDDLLARLERLTSDPAASHGALVRTGRDAVEEIRSLRQSVAFSETVASIDSRLLLRAAVDRLKTVACDIRPTGSASSVSPEVCQQVGREVAELMEAEFFAVPGPAGQKAMF